MEDFKIVAFQSSPLPHLCPSCLCDPCSSLASGHSAMLWPLPGNQAVDTAGNAHEVTKLLMDRFVSIVKDNRKQSYNI